MALNSTINNFEMTIALLLDFGSDKNLEEIQQIMISIKIINLAKYVISGPDNNSKEEKIK